MATRHSHRPKKNRRKTTTRRKPRGTRVRPWLSRAGEPHFPPVIGRIFTSCRGRGPGTRRSYFRCCLRRSYGAYHDRLRYPNLLVLDGVDGSRWRGRWWGPAVYGEVRGNVVPAEEGSTTWTWMPEPYRGYFGAPSRVWPKRVSRPKKRAFDTKHFFPF